MVEKVSTLKNLSHPKVSEFQLKELKLQDYSRTVQIFDHNDVHPVCYKK